MWNLKKGKTQMNELTKQRLRRLMVARGKVTYTLLYLKWMINKNLLYSKWNSAQCYVPAWGRMNTCIYMYGWVLSLFTLNYHNTANRLYRNTRCFWCLKEIIKTKFYQNKNKKETLPNLKSFIIFRWFSFPSTFSYLIQQEGI